MRSSWDPGFVCLLLLWEIFFSHNFVDLLGVVWLEWFGSGVWCKQSNFFYNADMKCF
jgi:hypothetical protein